MKKTTTLISASLATYYDTYNRSKSYTAASLAIAPKYLLFPEHRAAKVELLYFSNNFELFIYN